MTSLPQAADALLDWLVVPSFTRIGFDARRRLFDWPADTPDLRGRVMVVTGATAGLGRAAATALAARGATTAIVGRDPARTRTAADEIAELAEDGARPEPTGASRPGRVVPLVADLGDLAAVRALAAELLATHDRLDAVVHNAGALDHRRQEAPGGLEQTVASQVVGPFLLTALLLERLAATPPGRVITVSSGGMYAADLTVEHLQMDAAGYDGTRQYALAKRAQVALNEEWARRVDPQRVVFHAMHPGWADTPGVATSLPTFRRVVGPLLRTPDQGADTMVWLATDDGEPLSTTGGFWLDRRTRPLHRLPGTRRSDTSDRRRELWSWVADQALGQAGYEPEPAAAHGGGATR